MRPQGAPQAAPPPPPPPNPQQQQPQPIEPACTSPLPLPPPTQPDQPVTNPEMNTSNSSNQETQNGDSAGSFNVIQARLIHDFENI